MTDEERIDQICQELFEKCQVQSEEAYNGITRGGIVIGVDVGYKVAIEAMRDQCQSLWERGVAVQNALEAERARSAKLLEAAKWSSSNRAPLIFADAPEHLAHFFKKLDQAIAEYEATRD